MQVADLGGRRTGRPHRTPRSRTSGAPRGAPHRTPRSWTSGSPPSEAAVLGGAPSNAEAASPGCSR
eukprot:11360030-Alexandrium_andersonii.AAC.1